MCQHRNSSVLKAPLHSVAPCPFPRELLSQVWLESHWGPPLPTRTPCDPWPPWALRPMPEVSAVQRLHSPHLKLRPGSQLLTTGDTLLFVNTSLKCQSKFQLRNQQGLQAVFTVWPPKAHSPFKAMVPARVPFLSWPSNPSLSCSHVLWCFCVIMMLLQC